MQDDDDDDDDDDDNDDPMILNNRAKNHTSERTIVPWTVIFTFYIVWHLDVCRRQGHFEGPSWCDDWCWNSNMVGGRNVVPGWCIPPFEVDRLKGKTV